MNKTATKVEALVNMVLQGDGMLVILIASLHRALEAHKRSVIRVT
jgi:hypothetical protein